MRRPNRHKPRPFKNWRRGLRHAVRLRSAIARNRRIVLDHQMGKVGSLSVARAISAIPGVTVFHSHWIPPRSLAAGPQGADAVTRALFRDQDPYGFGPRLWREALAPGRPVDVVTLVRDPIARNISWYFDLLDKFWRIRNAHEKIPLERLHAEFFDRFDHDVPIRWFDDQIRAVYGVDAYAHAFDPEIGWTIIEAPPLRLLILRTELPDASKAAAIEAFFDRPPGSVTIPERNVSAAKPHAGAYELFRRSVTLPDEYLDRMYGSRMAQRFFSAEELDRLRARWRRSPAAPAATP